MWRLIDTANALTLTSLVAGFAAILFAIQGLFSAALIALIIAGICDLFDGVLARSKQRGDQQRALGQRLDSLVDGCSFGLAPAVVLFAFGLNAPWQIVLLAVFVVATVLRVGYYDVVGLDEEANGKNYYQGLPCTYVALVLPLAFLLRPALGSMHEVVLTVIVIGLIVAMTASVKIVKPRGLAYVGFATLAVTVCSVLLMYPQLLSPLPGS